MKSLTAQRIKEALNLKIVMEHYGIVFNPHGFARCCFHEEKTASLSVKGVYFKCFGCGAGGDVVAFTMQYFGISFPQALVRLDNDFRLGIIGQKVPSHEVCERRQKLQKRRRELLCQQAEYMYNTRYHRLLVRAYKTRAPKKPGDAIDGRYAAACRYLPALAYWFETHGWPRGWDQ